MRQTEVCATSDLRGCAGCSYYLSVQSFRRRLPHQYTDNQWLFVTWHLHGSVPHGLYPPPEKLSSGKAFVWMDRYLDAVRIGPRYLGVPDIARSVVDSIRNGVLLRQYELRAFVVMSNHVHVLLLPLIPPSRLLQSLKGKSARDANRILGRTGEKFWQAESYDHWVRTTAELERIAAYIEHNPVKAGLVGTPEEYPWSSATSQKENFTPKRPTKPVLNRSGSP